MRRGSLRISLCVKEASQSAHYRARDHVFVGEMADPVLSDAPHERRRTIVIYKSTAAEAPSGAAPSADGSLPKEKLASHKNLMYSEREAELIEDLTRFLIEKQPSYVPI